MAIDPEFGRRLRTAKREWETRHDRSLSNKELAELVRDEAGAESLSGQAVGTWLNEGQEPGSLALLRALAKVLEVPVSRLVGEEPEAVKTLPGFDKYAEPEDLRGKPFQTPHKSQSAQKKRGGRRA